MIAATPASSKRRAMSSAVSSDVSAQPSTATLPSRASSPTATRPGYFFAASFTSAGSRTAAVPMMTRLTPFSSQPSTVAMSRMPPPSCTHSLTVSRMRSTAARSPACRRTRRRDRRRADTRSPASRRPAPARPGSRLNTVARAMSPCSRRTRRRPSDRWRETGSRLPLQKIGDQREPEPLALLGMELRAGHSCRAPTIAVTGPP